MTVPSSRSVPRDLPVRSTGPDTSSTSSSIWKARPMRRANEPSASASAREPLRRAVERPEAARRLEQRGGLQLAAAQVALDRHVRRVGVLALQQLAARPAPSWRPTARAAAPTSLVARELGERAREQQIPGGDRHLAAGRRRPPWGARGAAARRRSGRRGRASPSARARRRPPRAPSVASPAASPAGRRRTPRRAPRAAGAGACPRP